ncbi:unnamed protein product [Effrenium voratum]|nr:unnamed protein product [Effrenium voratum]
MKLLYRASRDGFSAQAFHQKCDAHGPAVVIARSQAGYIFGRYTDTAFNSSGGYRQCSRSFLFHLSGPSIHGPSKHVIFQNHQHGICCSSNHAATFGGGHDMQIFPADAAARVAFSLGYTYQAAGTGFNYSFLAEGPEAVVTEWEVFQIQNNGEGAQLLCLKNYLEAKVAEWQEQEQAKEWSVVNKLLQVMNSGVEYAHKASQEDKKLHYRCQTINQETRFMTSGNIIETFRSTLLWQNDSALAAKFKPGWIPFHDSSMCRLLFCFLLRNGVGQCDG